MKWSYSKNIVFNSNSKISFIMLNTCKADSKALKDSRKTHPPKAYLFVGKCDGTRFFKTGLECEVAH